MARLLRGSFFLFSALTCFVAPSLPSPFFFPSSSIFDGPGHSSPFVHIRLVAAEETFVGVVHEVLDRLSERFDPHHDVEILLEKSDENLLGISDAAQPQRSPAMASSSGSASSLRSSFRSSLSCTSAACQEVADEILSDMDPSADPCEDADKFICGGWQQRFDLPADETGWTISFDSIANRTRHVIKDILEERSCAEMKDGVEGGGTNTWDAVSTCLYESCMDTEAMDAKGGRPLMKLLFEGEHSLDFLVAADLETEGRDLGEMSAKGELLTERLYRVLVTSKDMYFWGFWVGLNTLDPSKNQTLRFHGSGLGLSYHFYEEKHADIQSNYRQHLANLLELFEGALEEYSPSLLQQYRTVNPNRRDFSLNERAQRIFDFEVSLRELLLSPEESRDVMKYTRPITYGELKQRSPLLGLEKLLTYYTDKIEKPIGDDYEFLIHEEDYLERLAVKLHSLDWSVLHDYVLVHTVSGYASMLSKEWRDEQDRYAKQRSGADPLPRWRRCRVSPPSWIIARRYVNEKFDRRRKTVTQDLVANLKTAFAGMLDEYDWMSDDTTALALSKLDAMQEKLAFPDWLMDDYEPYFLRYYGPAAEGLAQSGNYFNAKMYFGERATAYELSQFGEPQDLTEWYMTPQSVNAYYSPSMNQVAFMAAILEKPSVYVWQEGGSRAEQVVMMAMTYGGIGGIIGHEITHGFDDKGKDYDEEGKLHSWWSATSEANFQEKAQCVEDQYSNYSVNLEIENVSGEVERVPLSVRGSLTLGENIADNGGVQLSWNALKLRLTAEELISKPLASSGVDMTVAQLFMFAWGHFWCSVNRPKAVRKRIETDPHSPDEFRTKGPLANFPLYAQYYSCPAGSFMNPENRCRVW